MPVPEQNRKLFERAARGDASAQSRIVEENMGLVHSSARHFLGRGVEYDDLFQAGCMGLVKAVAAFDLSRGTAFSTYAVPVILGEMRRLFRDDGPVKVSRALKEQSMRAVRTRESLRISLGREPSIAELAYAMGLDVAETAQALEASAMPLSLTVDDDGDAVQADVPVESSEDEVVDRLALKEALGSLPAVDRRLILLRYFKGKTQCETARLLEMTQVQVSRREKRILQKLRERLTG